MLEVRIALGGNPWARSARRRSLGSLRSLARWCRPCGRSRRSSSAPARPSASVLPGGRARAPVPGAGRHAARGRGAGRPARPAPPRRRRALPRARPDRPRLPPRRDRDHPRPRRSDRARRAVRAVVAPWRAGRVQFDNGGRSARRPDWARSSACAFTRAPPRCSSRPASHGATARSSTSTTPSTSASSAPSASPASTHLTKRASAFERFHNAQHRYSATGGLTPEQTTAGQAAHAAAPHRAPRRLAGARQGPVHPLHPLRPQAPPPRPRDPDARRQRLPVRHRDPRPRPARRRAQPARHNDQGELLTTARLPTPAGDPANRRARRRISSPRSPGSAAAASPPITDSTPTHLGKRCVCGNSTR